MNYYAVYSNNTPCQVMRINDKVLDRYTPTSRENHLDLCSANALVSIGKSTYYKYRKLFKRYYY